MQTFEALLMNNAFSPVFLLSALAFMVLLAALCLFLYARQQTAKRMASSHLQRAIQRQSAEPKAAQLESSALAQMLRESPLESQQAIQWEAMSIWGMSTKVGTAIALGGLLIFLLAWVKAGAVLGLVGLLAYALICVFFVWRRVEKQRQRMLEQLPSFLDNMVRLITIGNSTQASFQMAVPSVPMPLGGALGQASSVLTASSNLGQAMENLSRTWKLPEFALLAAVFRMSTQYGGRTDQVLDRVSAYIRDRLSAERELHAMSAEVRLSAWILSLLPIVVGVLIMVMNDGYFLRMWRDESGRQMIALAAGLELIGVALLYRLAKLR